MCDSTFFCIIFLVASSCNSNFDKEVWLRNKNSDYDNPRFEMVDDLMKNHIKLGMNRREILDLLGGTTYTDKDSLEYSYEIGSNPGFHIDPYFFVIDFDTKGQLTKSWIEEH